MSQRRVPETARGRAAAPRPGDLGAEPQCPRGPQGGPYLEVGSLDMESRERLRPSCIRTGLRPMTSVLMRDGAGGTHTDGDGGRKDRPPGPLQGAPCHTSPQAACSHSRQLPQETTVRSLGVPTHCSYWGPSRPLFPPRILASVGFALPDSRREALPLSTEVSTAEGPAGQRPLPAGVGLRGGRDGAGRPQHGGPPEGPKGQALAAAFPGGKNPRNHNLRHSERTACTAAPDTTGAPGTAGRVSVQALSTCRQRRPRAAHWSTPSFCAGRGHHPLVLGSSSFWEGRCRDARGRMGGPGCRTPDFDRDRPAGTAGPVCGHWPL